MLEFELQTLRSTPTTIASLLQRSKVDPRRRPDGEHFSLVENVCHLRDIEAEGYCIRIRRILEEERPELPDVDGAKLAAERRYNDADLNAALAAFRAARDRSVGMLATVTEADLDRKATWEGVGEVSLRQLVEKMVEHDLGHLAEIRQLLVSNEGRREQ